MCQEWPFKCQDMLKFQCYRVMFSFSISFIFLVFLYLQSSHTSSSAGSSSAEAIVQPTVKEAFQRQASYGPSSHRAKEINHAIAYYIAKDMIPVHTVAKPGFQKLMKTTVPLFKIPSEKFFSKTELHRMYTSLKEEVGKSIALENGMQQPLTCGPAVEEADIHTSASPSTIS